MVDLVKHEGIYERFKMTRTRLENELFGENADWNCLVATNKLNKLMGFCFYTFANINRAFNTQPMIQVDDLYVNPSYRKMGIAYQLLRELALIAKTKGIGRLNIWCVKNNDLGQYFYNRVGATKVDFIDVYSMQIQQLLEHSEIAKN